MKTFEEQKASVKSFMEAVEEERIVKEQEDSFMNSPEYKYKALATCKDEAREKCLNGILSNIYKKALPLNDDYKNAHCEDLDKAFEEFIKARCPQGIEFYVKEAIRRNSPFAKKVLEAVEEFVNNEYHNREMNIEDIDAKDLVFKTTDDVTKRLDVIGQNLQGPEIAQAVHDNVKATALSEITRAKNEKEALANLEKELANDVNMNTPAAVESALELRGLTEKKDFQPSLFQGIMIGKLHDVETRMESEEIRGTMLYDTLKVFGKTTNESAESTVEEVAFVECVKEFTAHQMMKSLRFESYYPHEVDELAMEYASVM